MARYYYLKHIVMCKLTNKECQLPHHNEKPDCDNCEVAKSLKLSLESDN